MGKYTLTHLSLGITSFQFMRIVRSPNMQQETLRLKEEIQRLKNEQTEMYKTQGQNAQRLVDMNDKLRAHEVAEKEANQQ